MLFAVVAVVGVVVLCRFDCLLFVCFCRLCGCCLLMLLPVLLVSWLLLVLFAVVGCSLLLLVADVVWCS